MKKYYLITFSTQEGEKAPNVMHVSFREDSPHLLSEDELFAIAKGYVGNPNLKYTFKSITPLTEKQYLGFFEGQIIDFLREE